MKDLLDLDFGGNNQAQQVNQPTNQNSGFDFFGGGTSQTNTSNQAFNQGFGGQTSMNQSQGQIPQTNTNDLMGLEFGNPNQGTNQNNMASNAQVDFSNFGNQNQTSTPSNTNANLLSDSQAQKKV